MENDIFVPTEKEIEYLKAIRYIKEVQDTDNWHWLENNPEVKASLLEKTSHLDTSFAYGLAAIANLVDCFGVLPKDTSNFKINYAIDDYAQVIGYIHPCWKVVAVKRQGTIHYTVELFISKTYSLPLSNSYQTPNGFYKFINQLQSNKSNGGKRSLIFDIKYAIRNEVAYLDATYKMHYISPDDQRETKIDEENMKKLQLILDSYMIDENAPIQLPHILNLYN